jgi:aspartate/methionine/tyrosine aminotransferase
LADSEIKVIEEYLNSQSDSVLLVDETHSFLYDNKPLISRFKNPQFAHLSIYSGDKFCFWDNLGITWAIGSPQLVKILLMYQQAMVFCPTTPLVHAFNLLFEKFIQDESFEKQHLDHIRYGLLSN